MAEAAELTLKLLKLGLTLHGPETPPTTFSTVVTAVHPKGQAEAAGIQPGDVVLSIDIGAVGNRPIQPSYPSAGPQSDFADPTVDDLKFILQYGFEEDAYRMMWGSFKKSGSGPLAGFCYAEHGALGGFVWSALDRTPAGERTWAGTRVYGFDELLYIVRSLPPGSLWRHNVAGDLLSNDQITVDAAALQALVDANKGRRGFTFTHYDVLKNPANRTAIADANKGGFTINLSGNALAHADALAELRIAPVTVILPAGTKQNTTTPRGRRGVICPSNTHGVTCAECGLCARQRSTIIGFPASGGQKHKIT
jgi:hypothetical protein